MKIKKLNLRLNDNNKVMVVTLITMVSVLFMLITLSFMQEDKSIEAGEKAYYIMKIHPITIQNNFTIDLLGVDKDISGLYSVTLSINKNENVTVYLTKDLDYIVLSKIYDYEKLKNDFEKKMKAVEYKNNCDVELNSSFDAVFIYSRTCPHCRNMIPFVEHDNTLNWYLIDGQDSKCKAINLTQFEFKGAVPHFYCIKTKQIHIGELSEEEFNTWVTQCKQ